MSMLNRFRITLLNSIVKQTAFYSNRRCQLENTMIDAQNESYPASAVEMTPNYKLPEKSNMQLYMEVRAIRFFNHKKVLNLQEENNSSLPDAGRLKHS